jgi:hypothetical protein
MYLNRKTCASKFFNYFSGQAFRQRLMIAKGAGWVISPAPFPLDRPSRRGLIQYPMKTSFQKQSFGGGYGINRSLSAERHLTAAIPPHSHVTRSPGRASASATGKSGNRHFAGAKIQSPKAR